MKKKLLSMIVGGFVVVSCVTVITRNAIQTDSEKMTPVSANDGLFFQKGEEFELTELTEDGTSESWKYNREPTFNLDVYVSPIHTPETPVLYSRVAGSAVSTPIKVEMQKVKLCIPESRKSEFKTLIACSYIPYVVQLLLYFWFFLGAMKMEREYRKGMVFSQVFSKYLLISAYLLFMIPCGAMGLDALMQNISTLRMACYDIHFVDTPNITLMGVALLLIILSKVITKGEQMKEEQDLTI